MRLRYKPKVYRGYIKTNSVTPDSVTEEGAMGWSRDAKSELFLLAVTNMVSEDTFYESGEKRDKRFIELIYQVSLQDPQWLIRFIPFLRNTMNMRSASIVMAVETVRALLASFSPLPKRSIVSSAIVRADEPAEMLGYYLSAYGRNIPQPIKRGVADAVSRLYTDFNVIKYDGTNNKIRFADVIELVHPTPDYWQSKLFSVLVSERHGHAKELDRESLLANNRQAMSLTKDQFRLIFSEEFVKQAGLTWEQASSKYGKLDAKFWDAMIPSMGIFALVRNLRNFDESNISQEAYGLVVGKLTDKETIQRSRMFPLRFLSASKEAGTRWQMALDTAANLSMANIPALNGRTLILVDLSGSMDAPLSLRSRINRYEAASLFGAAIALRAENADLVAFSDASKKIAFNKNVGLLNLARITAGSIEHGGTRTFEAFENHFASHDRVIVLTDEQAMNWGGSDRTEHWLASLPNGALTFTFNLAGYKTGHLPSNTNKFTFGGLTDAGFMAISLIEKGMKAEWPF